MGLIWGQQNLGGPHVGSKNIAIWEVFELCEILSDIETGPGVVVYLPHPFHSSTALLGVNDNKYLLNSNEYFLCCCAT